MIAALYVQPDGCYANLDGVDLWPEARDARKYAGPWPVVAHPPCQRWGNLAALNFKRYGGEHNRPGNDGGCFASALAAVRRWGGVLEHPGPTNAWRAHGLTEPVHGAWLLTFDGEWVCEVWQSAYGHRARKSTWLLYVGEAPPPSMKWERKEGTMRVGGFELWRGKPALSKREANATPVEFRDALIAMARGARRVTHPA